MSILNLVEDNLDDSVEPTIADADTEVEIRIVSIKQDLDKNQQPFILPRFEIPDDPYSKEFSKFISLPNPEMSKKQLNNCRNALKAFFTAFDVDYSGDIELEDLVGRTTWAILGAGDDEEYGEQNYIKKWVNAG
jgi:hypothetical protein